MLRRTPETALLSVVILFFKLQVLKSFFGDCFFFQSRLKLLFWGIPHITLTPFSFVTCGTVQLFFERRFHHNRGPSLMISAWLITSSAQLRPAAHSSASSAAQRRAVLFPGLPCRALPCGALLLCVAVRCCAVLCWLNALL